MLYFILTLLIFASMEVVSKPLMGQIDPFVLTFWRFSAGTCFFLFYPGMFKRFKEIRGLRLEEWGMLFVLGILNSFLAMGLLQMAVKYSTAATAATVFCSNPVFVMIISSIMGLERFSFKKSAGMLIGLGAVALIMSEKGFLINHGAVFALSASAVFAFYTVLTKKTVSKINLFTVNLASFFFGSLANLTFIVMSGRELFPDAGFWTVGNAMIMFYLGFIVTGFGYITFFKTIQRFTAVSSSIIFMLKPAVAVILAASVLNEMLTFEFYAGLLIMLAGTVLIFSEKIIYLKNNLDNK